MSTTRHHARRRETGFTIVEVLIVIVLLGVLVAPIIAAFGPATRQSVFEERTLVFSNRARGTLARVASLPFSTLDAYRTNMVDLVSVLGSVQAATDESFTFAGTLYRPIVAIQDASSTTGGLLRITVTIDDISMQTLRADY